METHAKKKPHYPLFPAASMACRALGTDLADVAREAELGGGMGDVRTTFVDAHTYFRLWETMISRAARPDAVTFLGKTIATGPVIPAFFALSSAPTLRVGFTRLARYKRLIGPTAIALDETPEAVTLTFYSEDETVPMPASLGALHLVFAAERARTLTARSVQPLRVTLPPGAESFVGLSEDIGAIPETGPLSSIEFRSGDMDAPLVSQDDVLWRDVERDLDAQRRARDAGASMATRTVGVLSELLPSGDATIARVAVALGVSVSTLQRRLRDESQVFKELVRQSREDQAKRYLTKTDIAPTEISSLLGYREPNSFYRSFKAWTGVTPSTFRQVDRRKSPRRN
ncbi:MAG: helix-turn-helix domain-containing protein [Pseudomonadota bacterium]